MEGREKEPRKGLLKWIRWWWNDTPKDLEEQIRMIRKSHLAAAIICVGLVTGAGALVDGGEEAERISYHYTMEEGDTIYQVAARIATPKENINELTLRILEDNHIKDPGAVWPGTEITIYVDPATPNIR